MGYSKEMAVKMAWNDRPECGGGLHGNGPKSSGFWTKVNALEFCAVENVIKMSDKIKCQRAMVLMRNALPKIKKFSGSLYLSGCDLAGVTLPNKYKNKIIMDE